MVDRVLQPLVSEMLINGTWADFTSMVQRDNGNGIRILRRPLTWAERVAPTSASWIYKNSNNDLYGRNPNSAYFGLLGRNVQVRHRLRPVQATFSQATTDSWPNTSTGNLPWTNSGGAGSDYDCNGVVGTHTLTSANVLRTSFITPTRKPLDVTVRLLISAVATGAGMTSWLAIGADASNCYFARILWNTDNTVRLDLRKNVAGVETNLHPDGTAGETVGTYDVGISYYVRLQWHHSGFLRCKAWTPTGALEPDAWTISTRVRDTSIPLSTIAKAGLFSRRETGNTNTNPVAQFDDFEVSEWRFWGEIPSFSPTRDDTGRWKTVPVTAYGVAQRLGTDKSIDSPMTTAMRGTSDGDIEAVAHWSMEDPSGSTGFAPSMPNLQRGAIAGGVTLASYSGFAGSKPLPTLGTDANVTFVFPTDTDTGFWQMQCAFMVPTAWGVNADLLRIDLGPGQLYSRIFVRWLGLSSPTTPVQLAAYNSAGTLLASNAGPLWFNNLGVGQPMVLAVTDFYNAGTHTILLNQFDTIGGVTQVQLGFDAGTDPAIGTVVGVPAQMRASASAVHSGWCLGQVALYKDDTALTTPNVGPNARAGSGYNGELAGTRMIRLSAQKRIPFELIGDEDDTSPCGPQPTGSYLSIMQNTADVDQGILGEPRDGYGLQYITRTALLNQSAVGTFSHSTNHDLESFQVVDDDKKLRNRVTSRRSGGSFATAEVTTGPTSTQDPPDGVGEYAEDLSWNVASDDQLVAFAGWRALIGSTDEPRYPASVFARHRGAIAAVPALDSALLALDIADRYTIEDPPADLPPDDIKLTTQGYDETIANFEHAITLDGTAASPYDVWEADGATTRVTDDHALRTAVGTSDTTWEIANLNMPVQLVTDNAQDGWDWMIDGERVTVTDVTPPDIAFVGVGTADSGSSGSRTPGLPASLANGNLVLIFASARTGTPVPPASWDTMYADGTGQMALFGRIKTASWSAMPTVTYSGGAANEDTIAQSAAFSGRFDNIDNILVGAVGCLNGSAQDITTPGYPVVGLPENLLALYLGWKQDDYTSVAQPGSWNELQEASSTAGNDASQIWGYRLFTTRPAAGTLQPALVVTGGAAAISRGAVVIIASDYQLVTVTRAVNGVSKSHFAGAIPQLIPAPHVGL